MNPRFPRKNLFSRPSSVRRAGMASLVVMLLLSCVVLASAVSAGYLTTIYAPKNIAPPTTTKSSPHSFKARFLPPILCHNDQNA